MSDENGNYNDDYNDLAVKLNTRLSSGVGSSRTSHRHRSSERADESAGGALYSSSSSARDPYGARDDRTYSSSRREEGGMSSSRSHRSDADRHRSLYDGEDKDKDRERRHRERAERAKTRVSSSSGTRDRERDKDRDRERERMRERYRESERPERTERSERDREKDRERRRERDRERESRKSARPDAESNAKGLDKSDNEASIISSARTTRPRESSSRREGESAEDAERRRRRRERERGERTDRDRERDREQRRRERETERERGEVPDKDRDRERERERERRSRSTRTSSKYGEDDDSKIKSTRSARTSTDRDRDRDRDRERRHRSRSSPHRDSDDVNEEQFATLTMGEAPTSRNPHSASHNPIAAIPPPRDRRSRPYQSSDFENFVVAGPSNRESTAAAGFDTAFTVAASETSKPNEFDDTAPQRNIRRQQIFDTFDENQAAGSSNRSTNRRSKWEELTAPRAAGNDDEEDPGANESNPEDQISPGSRHQSISSDGRRSRRSTQHSSSSMRNSRQSSGAGAKSERLSTAAALVAQEFNEDQVLPSASFSTGQNDNTADDHSFSSHEDSEGSANRRATSARASSGKSVSARPGLQPILSARKLDPSASGDADTMGSSDRVDPRTISDNASNYNQEEKNSTSPEDTKKEKEENWALKVRLLSAVDLPPYLTPSSPLCPIVKLGIVTDPELALQCENIVKSQSQYDALLGDSSDEDDRIKRNAAIATVRLPHSNDERKLSSFTVPDNPTAKHGNHSKMKPSSLLVQKQRLAEAGQNAKTEQDRLDRLGTILSKLGISHIPYAHNNVRFTTGQIVLSKTDNGTAEFQEEIRWDGMKYPMAMTLVLELCARPLPQVPGSSPNLGPSTLTSGGGSDTQIMESFRTLRSSLLRTRSGGRSEMYEGHHEGDGGDNRAPGGGVLPEWNKRKTGGSSLVPPMFSMADGGGSVSGVSQITSATLGNTTIGDSSDLPNSKPLDPSVVAMNAMNAKLRRETEELARKAAVNDDESVASGFSSPDLSSKARRIEDLQEKYSKHGRSNLLGGLFKPRRSGGTGRAGSTFPEGKKDELESATAAAAVARYIMDNKGKHPDDPDARSYISNEDAGSHDGSPANSQVGASNRRVNMSSSGWVEEGGSSDDDENRGSRKSGGGRRSGDSRRGTSQLDPRSKNGSSISGAGDADHEHKDDKIVEDVRLATLLIPLSKLPFDNEGMKATISKWYAMDATVSSNSLSGTTATTSLTGSTVSNRELVMNTKRSPSVLLELSFSSTKVLDDSEDEMEGDEGGALMWGDGEDGPTGEGNGANRGRSEGFDDKEKVQDPISPPKPKPKKKRKDKKKKVRQPKDPSLEHGLIDFACVLGPKSIGSQRNDDGSKGWVESNPEVTVLERWPKTDEFHGNRGRYYSVLPNMVEWFSFPEGCKLWRGTDPPTHFDLKPRSSSSTPSASISAFDACLKCASSFTWFVISSTGEDYGSRNIKTVGAVIRFFAPAPFCIDLTQDDYAQFHTMSMDDAGVSGLSTDNADAGDDGPEGVGSSRSKQCAWSLKRKRLWVPLAICLTSTYPIVGILEAMLLRLCETLAYRAKTADSFQTMMKQVHIELANIIVNCSCPIPGVLHCSVPFLSGERLHVTLPPPTGLPPLPHGSCVTSVCRLLGAEGLITLLAAVLTECKILIHSSDIANLAMVAEVVVGALIYPFSWALPYIPVLPEAMLEFIEAPLSYFLGVPSGVMKFIDSQSLKDVVVFDLDQAGSPDYFDGGR